MNGVFDVVTDSGTDYQGVNANLLAGAKYPNSTIWGNHTNRRLLSWGFNTIAPFSANYVLAPFTSGLTVVMPYIAFARPSMYALYNSHGYGTAPVKDILYGVKSSVYSGYRQVVCDYWDQNFWNYLSGELQHDTYGPYGQLHGPHNDYAVGIEVDQEDELGGFGAGMDFPIVVNGVASGIQSQFHIGWVALVTAPTQSSNTSRGVTYTDTTVYTKLQLSSYLSTKYGGSIPALNSAWGSKYSTFGSNGGFGVGSGLLDEDGTCPAKITTCWVPSGANIGTLAGATATMKSDLDGFLLLHAQHYFSSVRATLNSVAPGFLYLGADSVGGWGTPPRRQILQAEGQYVDVIGLSAVPPTCLNCTDIQQRIDFTAQYGGDKPWNNWEGYTANPDSYMSPYANPRNVISFSTQAARGQYWQQHMIPDMFNAKDTATGTYHVVGFKWWGWSDSRAESANWGLVDRRDNPYDGVSATPAQGNDAWGYPTGCVTGFGCEVKSYGDFLSYVRAGNLWALRSLVTAP